MKNEKPPAALAGGGLGAANCSLIPQASLPAYGLEQLIRMEGMNAALDESGARLELALKASITLKPVEQRG
ncbi:MAG: hypothetical protein WAN35_01220 [Terracidiphilus sp.]